MERCGISHFRKRLVKHLSGGYQQRVGIAQAIIHHPAFIVLDEPTNGSIRRRSSEIRRLIGGDFRRMSGNALYHILHEVQLCLRTNPDDGRRRDDLRRGIDDFNHSVSPRAIVVSVADAPQPDRWLDIPGIAAVEPLPEQAGTFRLFVSGESDRVCEQVVRHAVGHDWRLREIRKELRLPTIFSNTSHHNPMKYRLTFMKQIRTIARAELGQLFYSPIAWLIIILFGMQVYQTFTAFRSVSLAADQDMHGGFPMSPKRFSLQVRDCSRRSDPISTCSFPC